MYLKNDQNLFKRILTLTFVGITLFVPIKNNKEDLTHEGLNIKVNVKDLFEKEMQFSNIKEQNKSLSMSDICK